MTAGPGKTESPQFRLCDLAHRDYVMTARGPSVKIDNPLEYHDRL